MPKPVQLPGLVELDGVVLAVGGLDAADTSVADVVRVAPGAAKRVAELPSPVHDVGAATLRNAAYVFGGGTASGPVNTITRIDGSSHSRTVGRLPVAMSDTEAVPVGNTVYVIGGFTDSTALRSVLAFRPGLPIRDIATLPHPIRYAAAAAVGSQILIAGGTDGIHARREVLSVSPLTGRVRVIAHLRAPLAHAAGVSLDGAFYVLGGRGDGLSSQRREIWEIDPRSPKPRLVGRLPAGLSDLSAITVGGTVLAVGGRDSSGMVHDEILSLRKR